MTYSYACDGTPLSNLRSLSQTRSHYDRGGDEKSDRDPARDCSSHPFCSCRHLYISCHSACGSSFFLAPSDLHGLSLFVPATLAPFAPSPCILSPFCLSPPPFSLSLQLFPPHTFIASHTLVILSLGLAGIIFSFSCSLHEFSCLSSPRIRLLRRLGTVYIRAVIDKRTA